MAEITTVQIELDKPRTLKLTLNAMIRFEKDTGKSFFQANKDMSIEELRKVFWLCLLHEDPDLTEDQVGEMIHLGNLQYVSEKLFSLVGESMPEGAGGTTTEPPEGNLQSSTG